MVIKWSLKGEKNQSIYPLLGVEITKHIKSHQPLLLESEASSIGYYKHEVMLADDKTPIGLLICTDYVETAVQYPIEGLLQNLFVSKYRLPLIIHTIAL